MFGASYFGQNYFGESYPNLGDAQAPAVTATAQGSAKDAFALMVPDNRAIPGDSLGFFSLGEPIPIAYGKVPSTGLDSFRRSEPVAYGIRLTGASSPEVTFGLGTAYLAASLLKAGAGTTGALAAAQNASVRLQSNIAVTTASGTALSESEAIAAIAALSSGLGLARDATALTSVAGIAIAELAVGIGAASNASVLLGVKADLDTGTLGALEARGFVVATGGKASPTALANVPKGLLQALAGQPTGTGMAWPISVLTGVPGVPLELIHAVLVESAVRQYVLVMEKVGELVGIE